MFSNTVLNILSNYIPWSTFVVKWSTFVMGRCPLLFLIYINDLPNGLNSNAKLFVDDT